MSTSQRGYDINHNTTTMVPTLALPIAACLIAHQRPRQYCSASIRTNPDKWLDMLTSYGYGQHQRWNRIDSWLMYTAARAIFHVEKCEEDAGEGMEGSLPWRWPFLASLALAFACRKKRCRIRGGGSPLTDVVDSEYLGSMKAYPGRSPTGKIPPDKFLRQTPGSERWYKHRLVASPNVGVLCDPTFWWWFRVATSCSNTGNSA